MSKKILVGFIVFILIYICIYLQINFLNYIQLFGVSANIGIIFVTGIGILSGKVPGGITGATYGILLDLLYGKSFGVYFMIYMALGIASGVLSKGFSKENKLSVIYMSAIFTVIVEALTYFCFIIIYRYTFEFSAMINIILKETIYNIFIAAILFKPLTLIGEIINKSKKSYYLL